MQTAGTVQDHRLTSRDLAATSADLAPELEPFSFEGMDLFSFEAPVKPKDQRQTLAARATKHKARVEVRRAKSEAVLAEILPAPLDLGASYHVISGGDVDAQSYLARILEESRMDYVLFSTWCMALPDVEQFGAWVAAGKIGRLDAYVGEIFPNQYRDLYARLAEIVRPAGGRVAVFRNHAKVFAGRGAFDFAVSSSANINTNPRTENTVVSFGPEIFGFYKSFFDGIRSFNRDFDDWRRWEPAA